MPCRLVNARSKTKGAILALALIAVVSVVSAHGTGGNHKVPGTPAETSPPKDQPPADEGKALYEQICAACHGFKGEGLPPVAPPLTNSIWVAGAEGRILRIVLHGLKGPIHVNGATYQPPRVLPEMPPLAAMEDTQIAAVASYIRHRWGGATNTISPEKIAALRAETAKREQAWTEPELLQIK